MRGVGDADEADRVVVDVVVVGEQRRRVDQQRRVLDRRDRILDRGRRIVDGSDMHDGRAGGRAFAIVGHDIAEAVIAGEGVRRRIDGIGSGIAVEVLGQHCALAVATERPREADVEVRGERQRHVARERAGRAVDGEPARQRRAVRERRAPDRAIELAELGRRRDAGMGELDDERAARRLAQRQNPQRIAVAIEVVAQQIGHREARGLAFASRQTVDRGVRPLARRLHIIEDQRRIAGDAALLVGAVVAQHDRAVEVGRNQEVDLLGRDDGGGRERHNLEGIVDHGFGNDRHRRMAVARGDIEADRHRADPVGGRHAGEGEGGGVEAQPVRQRRAALARRGDRTGTLQVDREQALAREIGFALQRLVDRHHLAREIAVRIDDEFQREAAIARGVGPVGKHARRRREHDLQARQLGIRIHREAAEADRARRCVEGQPIRQRTAADDRGRNRPALGVEQRDLAVIADAARQRGRIQRHAVGEGRRIAAACCGMRKGELNADRIRRPFRWRARELQRLGVEAEPGRQHGAIGKPGRDGRARIEIGRIELVVDREGGTDLVALEDIGPGIDAARNIAFRQLEPRVEDPSVRGIAHPDVDGERIHSGRRRARKPHGGGIELQPGRQRRAVGQGRADLVTVRQIAVIDHAEHGRALEEQHVAVSVDIVAERLGRDHEQRTVLQAADIVVAQNRSFVARQHRDRDIGGRSAATAVADRVLEPGGAVVIRRRPEFDHAVVAQANLTAVGEPGDAVEHQRIAVLVGVVGQDRRRVDQEDLVLEGPGAIVIVGLRRVVERLDLEVVGQGRRRAARVDHVIFDACRAERGRREGDGAGRLVEHQAAIVGGVVVETAMQADEGETVALDVVGVGQEVGDRNGGILAETDPAIGVAIARRVVDRRDRDLDPGGRGRAAGVGQRVDEACRTEIVRTQLELDVIAIQLRGDVAALEAVVGILVTVDRLSGRVGQRRDRNDVQLFQTGVAIDVEIVGEQGIDPDPQDLVLDGIDQRIIHRRRRVVDRREIDLDPGRGLTAELVAHRITEEGIAVVVRRAHEFDLSVLADTHGAVHGIADAGERQVDCAVGVIGEQGRRVDHDRLVLDAEMHDVVGGIEAPELLQLIDPVAGPDRAIGEHDLLDAALGPDEVVGDAHGVDQEPILPLEFEEEVIALADDGNVLRRDRRRQHQAVGVGLRALLGDDVLAVVEAEHVGIRAGPAADGVIAAKSLEPVVAGAAGELVVPKRADQHLDRGELVAGRFAGGAEAGRQIDRDALVGLAVIGDVEAAASVDDIGAAAAADAVVAGVASDRIVLIRALNDLDPGEGIAERIAAAGRTIGHVDGDPFGRQRVVGRIDALAAGQLVGATAADQGIVAGIGDQNVVAATSRQDVGERIAFQRVVGIATGQVLDVGQNIAFGIAAVGRA